MQNNGADKAKAGGDMEALQALNNETVDLVSAAHLLSPRLP